jgi:AcrR family transcriptional regulator
MTTPALVEPRKSPRQRRSRQTVDDLLDATARVLIRDGWDAASTNRIARAAGISVGSLYQYFPNKDALVVALTQRHAEQMLQMLARSAAELRGAPLRVAVATFVRAMVEAHRVNPELHVVLVHRLLASGFAPVEQILGSGRALVRMWLEQHREELVVEDLDAAAWMCVTTVDAVVHAAVLDHRLDDPVLERELTAMILRYLGGA